MARYKNMEVAKELSGLIRHMDAVEEYRETLQSLQAVWDNLSLLGQLSGTGADMAETRSAFAGLSQSLLNQLGLELRAKAITEMRAKAQAAIDVLVRNLFERTADIGFLAMDEDIRAFLADAEADPVALRQRFAEYQAKYSVYFDIVLFDTRGQAVARLDESAPLAPSEDKLLRDALESSEPYLERYARFDFLPGTQSHLVYACRVLDGRQAPLGVLCLAFRFEDEMARIFAKLAAPDDHSVLLLQDGRGLVQASSDIFHVPCGARLPLLDDGEDCRLVEFAGNEYLFSSRAPKPFQGYAGPGWRGAVLLPLRKAFNKDASRLLEDVDPVMLAAALESPQLFGESLREIPAQANRIQRDLNRSVWNGTVLQGSARQAGRGMGNPAFSKVLLWEISKTGERTKEVFARSIANLHETIVSSVLHDCHFLAAQAIDIMDRNLYERANDCRWWALTSEFRRLLDAGDLDVTGRAHMADILAAINSLYTVYTNLIVFDRAGRVVAASQPDEATQPGVLLDAPWVREALALQHSQAYAVSEFAASPLYGGGATYVYAAAIRPPEGGQAVGGIGIVFDSAPQFAGMLRDILPKDAQGTVLDGCFGLFADAGGRVIASSDERFAPGDLLPPALHAAQQGSASRIVALDGHYYAVGCQHSSGYREYKGEEDAYRNAVDAMVFFPLCETDAAQEAPATPMVQVASDRNRAGGTVEIATFCLGRAWVGLPSHDVVEAIERRALVGVPGSVSAFAGYQLVQGEPMPVFDIAPPGAGSRDAPQVIIVQRPDGRRFGILADDLGDIPEVETTRLKPLPPDIRWGRNVMTEAVITADPPRDMTLLQVMSAERIVDWLLQNCPDEMAGEGNLSEPLAEAA